MFGAQNGTPLPLQLSCEKKTVGEKESRNDFYRDIRPHRNPCINSKTANHEAVTNESRLYCYDNHTCFILNG